MAWTTTGPVSAFNVGRPTVFPTLRERGGGQGTVYSYLKEVFRHLREALGVEVQREPKRLPYVPTDEEVPRYYEVVWKARRSDDIVMIKTLLYTGAWVSELVAIRLADVDLDACRIRINLGKGAKDRAVPFPPTFRETLALHMGQMRFRGASYLFESSWKRPYSARGVRAVLARYAHEPGFAHNMPPHRLRHFPFTWLKSQGLNDALIQPYSGARQPKIP